MSHFQLESRVHNYLAEKRTEEAKKRAETLGNIRKLRGSSRLPGDYPDDFIRELESTPLDWRIDIFEEGIRFLRDFPYEEVFYGMRGWDAARVVLNLDVEKATVAFRIHLFDQQSDMTIDEGVLVEGGSVTSYSQDISGYGLYLPILMQVARNIEETKGESGCTFDHLKAELDQLPGMLRQLCGETYGRLAAAFYRLVEEGKIDLETMPKLAVVWPLLSPYHAPKEEEQ